MNGMSAKLKRNVVDVRWCYLHLEKNQFIKKLQLRGMEN